VQLWIDDPDDERRDRSARELLTELRDVDLGSVELIRQESLPPGAKSAAAFTLGALAVAILPSVLPALIDFLKAWTSRGDNRSIRVKRQQGDQLLEVEYNPTEMSPDDVVELVKTLEATLRDG
jgi:hypothetical protein